MAFTSADLVVIDQAIAAGELRVQHGETLVVYADIDDLIQRRKLIVQEIAADSGSKKTRGWKLYQAGRGI